MSNRAQTACVAALHPFHAVRIREPMRGKWKVVHYCGPDDGESEFYDLANDRDEIANRAADRALAPSASAGQPRVHLALVALQPLAQARGLRPVHGEAAAVASSKFKVEDSTSGQAMKR